MTSQTDHEMSNSLDNQPATESFSADSDRLYREMRRFLIDAARKVDNKNFDEWLEMMTEDIHYRIPTRVTTAEGGKADFDNDTMDHIDDNRFRLEKRVERLQTEHAWAEQPPSRTRHFLSNIYIDQYDPEESRVTVISNLFLHMTRGGFTVGHEDQKIVLTGEQYDEVVSVDGEWKLDKRTVYLDHEVIPVPTISVFI